MYAGCNIRAHGSMRLLSEAFIRELAKKPYGKIGIKDLCRDADVSRQTFYNLFATKDELLEYTVEELFADLLSECIAMKTMTGRQSVEAFVRVMSENEPFIRLLYKNHLEGFFASGMLESFLKISDTIYSDRTNDSYLASAFYAGGLVSMHMSWLNDPGGYSAEQFIDLVEKLIVAEW